MKNTFAILGALFLFAISMASATSQIELKHKEITLYSGGYAFILREADVSGEGRYAFRAANFSGSNLGRQLFITDASGAATTWTYYNEDVKRMVERQKTLLELLNESVGKKIIVKTKSETISGNLAWYNEVQVAVSTPAGWRFFQISGVEDFTLPATAAKTRDEVKTLEYGLEVKGSGNGKRKLDVGYLTSGNAWNQGYVYKIDSESEKGTGEIESWAQVSNFEQENWNATTLYFIIGNPHFASFVRPYYDYYAYEKAAAPSARGVTDAIGVSLPSIEGQAATGYWKYKVSPVTLRKGEQASYQLFKGKAPYERKFIWDTSYNYGQDLSPARKIFAINNTGSELWGSGVLQVFEKNSLLGEDSIDMTPKNSGVEIYVSDVADLRGKREYISSNAYDSTNDRVSDTLYKITVENKMAGDAKLLIREHVQQSGNGINIDIITSTKYEKKPNGVVEWKQAIGEGKTLEISYTVRITEVGYYKKYPQYRQYGAGDAVSGITGGAAKPG